MVNHETIWLTRPATDSARLASLLAPRRCLIAPLTTIESIAADIPDTPNAVLLTSRHAAAFLAQLPASWRALPIYCVGAATAQVAMAHGFNNTHIGSGDLPGLLPQLSQLPSGTRLLYITGQHRRVDVAALLAGQGVVVTLLEVYRAAAIAQLPDPVCHALANGAISGVAFYSPRNAALACTLLADAGLASAAAHIDAFCLSLAVAHAAGRLPWRSLHACHIPTSEAMRELIVSQHPPHMV